MGCLRICFLLLLVACSLSALAVAVQRRSSGSFTSFPSCLAIVEGLANNLDALCAASKLGFPYYALLAANCKNCDRYFHCMGNRLALRECNNSDGAFLAAEIISSCREAGDFGINSILDQEANRYGRNGGDCSAAYLAAANCTYIPQTKTSG